MSIDIRKSYCRPRSNECRDGLLLRRLEERFGTPDTVAEVDLRLVDAAWAALSASGWLPAVPEPPYRATGAPLSGFAISLRLASQDYLLLTFGTGPIANDRYAYSEVLYRVEAGTPRIVKQIHYFVEIAGIEGLEWPVLWPLNAAVLLIVTTSSGAAARDRRGTPRRRARRDERPRNRLAMGRPQGGFLGHGAGLSVVNPRTPATTLRVRAALRILMLALAWPVTSVLACAQAATDALPTIGQPRELHGIRAALLHVERLEGRELETPHGRAPAGLRILWWVENRPGEQLAPVLGEVRVVLEGRQYNAVTNATSRKPFAPDMLIHGAREFLDRSGKTLEARAPRPRPGAVSVVLEVYVRGGPILAGARGSAEIELGRATATGTASYDWFRFRLPRLDD